MNDRAIKILKLLLENRDYKITDLEQEMNLSKRQINYTIKQINDYLIDRGVSMIERNFLGEFIIHDDIYYFLSSEITGIDFFTEEERMDFIYLYLYLSLDEISVFHIVDFLKISKNTVLSDLRQLKMRLSDEKIAIKFSRKKGYFLEGEEFNIRNFANKIIIKNNIYNRDVKLFIPFIQKYQRKTNELITKIEQKLKIKYSDESISFLIEAIPYTLARIEVINYEEWEIKSYELERLEEYHLIVNSNIVNLNNGEYLWLTLLFVTSNIYTTDNLIEISFQKIYHPEIYSIVHNMVKIFQNKCMICIKEEHFFEKQLYLHIRPMVFRMLYSMKIYDKSFDSASLSGGTLQAVLPEIVFPLEQYLNSKLPKEEMYVLDLYFQMHLTQYQITLPKKKAVVVCSNGILVSEIMRITLQDTFPELIFLHSLSVREFMLLEEEYDVVFTTIPLQTHIKQYLINPTMTDVERNKLRYQVMSDLGLHSIKEQVNEILYSVRQYGEINNYSKLKSDLEVILAKETLNEESIYDNLPDLSFYLKKSLITICFDKVSWQEAIDLSFQPLIERKIVERSYIQECKRQLMLSDNYSYFGKHMVVPHSDKVKDISCDSIGLLILHEPTQFPKIDTIYVVAPVVINNTSRHIKAINELLAFAQNEQNIHKLKSLNTPEAIYKFIIGGNKNEAS